MPISIKTVIRTKDLKRSLWFYQELLQMHISEPYDDGNGSKGVILSLQKDGQEAFIELSEILPNHEYFQEAFGDDFQNDKADLQMEVEDVNYWLDRLKQFGWNSRGPNLRPWGYQYLYLRDPDGLQIILYQKN